VISVAFKQNGVNHMFQFFGPNVSVFGNMANKNNGDIGLANFQFCRGFPNLGYTSCGRFDIIGMKGLNRINDYNFGLDRFNLFEDVLGFGFGKDVAVVTSR
jgi:hypothetical protein